MADFACEQKQILENLEVYIMKRVVVTGLGAITPIGNDVETLREGLREGRNGIGYITRFDTEAFKVKIAAEVKNFDPLQYIEKNQIRKMDLYTQYAVAAAAQAVEQSGLKAGDNIESARFGVYIGSGIGGMTTFINEAYKLKDGGPRKVSPFFVPMMIANMAAGTVAIRYAAKGPCLPIVTACATGTHSVGEAFHAIRNGCADAIICGGAEATLNPLSIAGFTNCMALTSRNDVQRSSIPFDKERDGFVLGEGSGVLVLEEYEHAVNRGARILAEITGYGNTCDAYHMTAPDPESVAAAAAMKTACEEGGILNAAGTVSCDASAVYINAHGTSTPLNDKSETAAIKKVFGTDAYSLKISSPKSMTGHMLGAAGGVEAVICVLALENDFIPPTINYSVPDEECDLDYTVNKGVTQKLDYAVSNSLGFGGHNACIVFKKI